MSKNRFELGFFVSLQLFVLYFLFLFVEKYHYFIISKYLNLNLFYFFSVSLFGFFSLFKLKDSKVNSNILIYIFLSLILSILILNLFQLNFNYSFNLFYFTLILGIIIIHLTSNKTLDLINNNSNNELKLKKSNDKKFDKKFKLINKIPILRTIIKWTYDEGLIYSLSLYLILFIGMLFRLYHLGDLNILVEEQYHYITAKNLIETGSSSIFYTSNDFFGYITYYRTFIYTIFTAIIFYFFGINEFNLRLTSVLFSLFTGVLTYIFLKKMIDKKYALLGVFLLMISSWYIWYSRWARHYVFDGFILLLSLYISYLVFYEKKSLYYFLIVLLLVPWIEIGNFIYLGIIFLLLFMTKSREIFGLLKKKESYIILFISVINILIYLKVSANTKLNTNSTTSVGLVKSLFLIFYNFLLNFFPLKFDMYFFNLLYKYNSILLLFSLISFYYLIINFKKVNSKLHLLLLFPALFIFLSLYDPSRTWQNIQFWIWESRHLSILIPIYFIFFSFSLYLFLNIIKEKILKIFLISIFCISLFSFSLYDISYGVDIKDTQYQVMTSENFYTNIKEPVMLLKENKKPQDLLIFDTMEVMYRAYYDVSADYRIGWDLDDNKTIAKSNINNKLPDDSQVLNSIILNNIIENNSQVWLLQSSYNDYNYHTRVRKGEIRKYLESHEECLFYSKNYTQIYRFNLDCMNK